MQNTEHWCSLRDCTCQWQMRQCLVVVRDDETDTAAAAAAARDWQLQTVYMRQTTQPHQSTTTHVMKADCVRSDQDMMILHSAQSNHSALYTHTHTHTQETLTSTASIPEMKIRCYSHTHNNQWLYGDQWNTKLLGQDQKQFLWLLYQTKSTWRVQTSTETDPSDLQRLPIFKTVVYTHNHT